jgi:hypothetical protein
MKFITTIIAKLIPKEIPTPVGRWRTEACNNQMNQKIDLSNEDHCGPCGQYALEKSKQDVHMKTKTKTHVDNPK